jgi:hypothetical protein
MASSPALVVGDQAPVALPADLPAHLTASLVADLGDGMRWRRRRWVPRWLRCLTCAVAGDDATS